MTENETARMDDEYSEQKAPQLLCSSGAFSRESDGTGYSPILEFGPQVVGDSVSGIEVIFYSHWYDHQDEITAHLRASALGFPVMHAEKSIGPLLGSEHLADEALALERLRRNCQMARDLGADLLVVHLWGLPDSDAHIERNLERLPACLDVAQEYGVTLAVETIPCTVSDPLTLAQAAIACDPRCAIALDSEFLAFHDQVEAVVDADWLWEGAQDNQKDSQSERVRHIHVKDYDGVPVSADGRRRYLHPGEGSIDFARLFAGLRERGFRGNVSLEASGVDATGVVHLERLHESLRALRRLMM